MKTDTIKAVAELAALLVQQRTDGKGSTGWRAEKAAEHALELAKLAHDIKQRGQHRCNYPINDATDKRYDRLDERCYARAREIAQEYGADVVEMGDVRGYAIKLNWAGTISNSMFERSWGVPSL